VVARNDFGNDFSPLFACVAHVALAVGSQDWNAPDALPSVN
jgi:hypothetical protein